MDELPKLTLIQGNVSGIGRDAFINRVERMLATYPIEYVEPLLEALIDYVEGLEESDVSDAMYYNLNTALMWYRSCDSSSINEIDGDEE